MNKTIQNIFLIIELIGLFIILPLIYFFNFFSFPKILPLILLFIYCLTILLKNKLTSASSFTLKANWKLIFLRFIIFTLILFGVLYFFTEIPLLADMEENKKLLFMIFMYPILSVFPQELIFREFFFSRYQPLFKNKTALFITNIILFSFAHIYFENLIVLAATVLGGALFTKTYLRTRSLLVVSVEHSLYGIVILTTGLSIYFYKAF